MLVSLDSTGRLEIEDIVAELRAAGGSDFSVDRRRHGEDQTISAYFFIEFDDLEGGQRRTLQGFWGVPSEVSPIGYTRLAVGADERGQAFMHALGEEFGGAVLVDMNADTKVRYPYRREFDAEAISAFAA